MKILEAFGEPISNGGQEAFVMNVIENIDKTNISIDLLTPYYCDNDYYKQKVENYGGEVFSFNKKFEPGKSRFNIVSDLNKFFKNHKYDVVHVHSGSISIFGIFAYLAKKNGVKRVIVHAHSSIERKTLKNKILKEVCNLFLQNNADIYCACSKLAGQSKFVDAVVNNKLVIVKNGIDISKFRFNEIIRKNLRTNLRIDEKFVIGHVGRFCYEKNHSFIIDVFYEILKIKKNAILLLIGSGNLEKKIKKKIMEMGIDDKVIFIGNVNDVYNYYQAMDCFVFPSYFEGLGIVAIEAQAAGLRCYLSDVIPNEVKFTDLVNFISLKEEPKYWTNKIVNAANNYDRKDMSNAIRKAGYDIKMEIRKIERIYFNK